MDDQSSLVSAALPAHPEYGIRQKEVNRGFFEEQGILKAEQGDSLADYGVFKG